MKNLVNAGMVIIIVLGLWQCSLSNQQERFCKDHGYPQAETVGLNPFAFWCVSRVESVPAEKLGWKK